MKNISIKKLTKTEKNLIIGGFKRMAYVVDTGGGTSDPENHGDNGGGGFHSGYRGA